MPDNEMITLRNKKTGEVVTVPREKYKTGFSGIASDVGSSLESALPAFGEMISSIPGGIKKAGRYALSNNPVETLGNLGAGGVEGAAQLASSPQVLARYLAEKFPELGNRMAHGGAGNIGGEGGGGIKDPTIYEALMNFEKNHGMSAQGEDESSVRNIGNLLFGGKGLTKLPNAASRVGGVTAQQIGAGGDPVHAAILGLTGELAANAPWNKVKNIPQAAVNAIKNPVELAGTAASSGLDTIAGLGAVSRIPIVPSMVEALSDYIKYKSIKPETLAKRNLFNDINPEDVTQINERMEAAKRLGLGYLTPAEATLSPFEAAKQGGIGRTSSGSKLLFQKGKERSGNEASAINNLLDTIYDAKELDPKKAAAYKETMKGSVSEDFIKKYSTDPVIAEAMEQLHKDPVYRKSLGLNKKTAEEGIVPSNTFEYWDQVKRVLGDMEEANSSMAGRKPFKKAVIGSSRRAMVADMDNIEPSYETARNISERQFTRNKLESVFDKKSMTGNNFSKFLQSKKNFNETMNKLKAFPEAQQKLKDMHLLFGDLIPNDMPIRHAAALKRTSMSESRNKVDAMKKILDERYGKEHDVAAVNLMTNPDWAKLLSQHLKNKGS